MEAYHGEDEARTPELGDDGAGRQRNKSAPGNIGAPQAAFSSSTSSGKKMEAPLLQRREREFSKTRRAQRRRERRRAVRTTCWFVLGTEQLRRWRLTPVNARCFTSAVDVNSPSRSVRSVPSLRRASVSARA